MTLANEPRDETPSLRPEFVDRLAQVAAYKAANGRLAGSRVSAGPDEGPLGRWLLGQRSRHRRGLLPPGEREAIATALGPWWTLPPAQAWSAEHPDAPNPPWLNNKMPKTAQPPRRPWTAEEEEAIMREDLTAEQAAQLTGRTVTAVNGRRKTLRFARRPIGFRN